MLDLVIETRIASPGHEQFLTLPISKLRISKANTLMGVQIPKAKLSTELVNSCLSATARYFRLSTFACVPHAMSAIIMLYDP